MISRAKGQFAQPATPHHIPEIAGSFLSVDGMVNFDTVYNQEDYPLLFQNIGVTYNKVGDDNETEFRTPSLEDWGLPELKTVVFTGSVDIDTYKTDLYDSGDIEATFSNSSKKERMNIVAINDSSDTGVDSMSVAVKDDYFDFTIAASIVNNRLRLSITDNGNDGEITMKYVVSPRPLATTFKNMIRF